MTEYVGAIDQGTTSTRTIVFDKKGTIVAIDQREVKQHYPKGGWVEHDAMQIFNDQQETFHTVVKKVGLKPKR